MRQWGWEWRPGGQLLFPPELELARCQRERFEFRREPNPQQELLQRTRETWE